MECHNKETIKASSYTDTLRIQMYEQELLAKIQEMSLLFIESEKIVSPISGDAFNRGSYLYTRKKSGVRQREVVRKISRFNSRGLLGEWI